nr:myotubularin-related protein 10 [Onthophagus taurus]
MFQLTVMNDFKNSRFKSYIDGSSDLDDISLGEQRSKLLEKEVIIREAPKVFIYQSISDTTKIKRGVLTVTNFKLSFIPDKDEEQLYYQQNYLLGPYEVCLSCIDCVYQLGDKSKKKLNLGQNVSGRVKELLIICKNMRSFHFNLKLVDRDLTRHITNAILYHVAPKRLQLLFAFDYCPPYEDRAPKESESFRTQDDWRKELERTSANNWRVCSANENYEMTCLPKYFVVPISADDNIFKKAARHFREGNGPVWVWGTRKNAALVRMSDLEPTITDRTQENIILEHIRKSHPNISSPHIMELAKVLPSIKELQHSFNKLRDICTPDTYRLFKTQDAKFYNLLEGTRWLQYVSGCLEHARKASIYLTKNCITVVLQEGSGRDLNCIISSLIQLILDPIYRTKHGFQRLIQKEWVVLGHPFRNRLGLLEDYQNEPAPYFLLFLDCVWQLLQQNPQAFQFNETYLTTLWDSVHVSIFDTFIFNSEWDRFKCKPNLRSVWDWRQQFSDNDIKFFENPLYDDSYKEKLFINYRISSLDLWRQCYLRWLPIVEISKGGPPQIDLTARLIKAEIYEMQQRRLSGDVVLRSHLKDEILTLSRRVNSFYPFSRPANETIPDNDLVSMDGLDTQSLLNLPTTE